MGSWKFWGNYEKISSEVIKSLSVQFHYKIHKVRIELRYSTEESIKWTYVGFVKNMAAAVVVRQEIGAENYSFLVVTSESYSICWVSGCTYLQTAIRV